MTRIVQCVYCGNWQSSPIHKIIKQQDEENEKKKKGKKKGQIEFRNCKITNRRVKGTTEACRYFKPRLYFYCYISKYWLSLYQCLNRRRNKKYYYKKDIHTEKNKKYFYPNCTIRCSQFKEDILPICNKLDINRLGKIRKPKQEHRKIKRRPKQEPRKIKRRVKRVIKRR